MPFSLLLNRGKAEELPLHLRHEAITRGSGATSSNDLDHLVFWSTEAVKSYALGSHGRHFEAESVELSDGALGETSWSAPRLFHFSGICEVIPTSP